ncbi:MAG: right-handed parallel beta-helix repeat-containing protein [Sedimentisphaerales bacterium]|nr:right-handed parallel beta-helix repeat-containing protein [Sedimentisphaerales bacterium]
MFAKKFSAVTILIFCFSLLLQTVYGAKSVFIISSHDSRLAEAFRIGGNSVSFQAMVDISTYNPGVGPVGIAVWPEMELAFFTYEGSPMIVWSSTKTLEKVGEFDTGVYNLAGIVVDTTNQKIYVAQRETNNLYVYSWNPTTETLILDSSHVLGGGLESAFGLALDETSGRLYVSNNTKTVRYYNTNTWAYQGSINIVVGGNDRPSVGIAVDPARGYLYTGNFYGTGYYHTSLVRTMTTSPYTSIETNLGSGCPVIGIDVDKSTGLVYCTTHASYGQYTSDFRVYNSSLTLLDTERNDGIESPAGVAVGPLYKYQAFSITKDNNDADCVEPYDWIYYNIHWDANTFADTNVIITDFLPIEINEPNWISNSGVYDGNFHTVKWQLGNVSASDFDTFTIQCGVNYYAKPGGSFLNKVEMEGDTYYANNLTGDVNDAITDVCPWGGEIIYVDKDAGGYDNGTNWNDAYNYLQDAFNEANTPGAAVTSIWVAAGEYKPVQSTSVQDYQNKSFILSDDVGLFGHFGGVGTYETNPSQRNLEDANNETILEGRIGQNYYDAVYNVVKANNINSAVVDGFTIKGSYYGAGIYLDNSAISIVNCKIKNNGNYGIYAKSYSYPDIHNCLFLDNTSRDVYSDTSQPDLSYCTIDGNASSAYGLYLSNGSTSNISYSYIKDHTGDGIYGSNATIMLADSKIQGSNDNGIEGYNSDLTVEKCILEICTDNAIRLTSFSDLDISNSIIRGNGKEGIYMTQNSGTEIIGNWIYNNGTMMNPSYGAGIYFENQIGIPKVWNNTIYDNYTNGIQCSQTGADPNIRNCIITGNDYNDLYRVNGTFNKVTYSCLQNAHSGTGNIIGDPCFFDAGSGDLHIKYESICKNNGSPGSYTSQTDIDGEPRLSYGRIDIGADEYYWSKADYNIDEVVDFFDYSRLAGDWQTAPSSYSLDTDNDIDIYDLDLFSCDWLWIPAWGSEPLMWHGHPGRVHGLEARATLMLTSISESIAAQPARLAAKTKKYYELTPYNTVSAIQSRLATKKKPDKITEVNINELLDWWDELWKSGDLEDWTYDDYLDFRKAIESCDDYEL